MTQWKLLQENAKNKTFFFFFLKTVFVVVHRAYTGFLQTKKKRFSHKRRRILPISELNSGSDIRRIYHQASTSQTRQKPQTIKCPWPSQPEAEINSPARPWPTGPCAAPRWTPLVLHGFPTAFQSSSQDSTHHPPHLYQAAGLCPSPRHTQILE